MLGRVSSYTVVVALHIIAAFLAFGLPLTYPLWLPYLRRHHPEALPGVHVIQYRLNLALTGPGTIALLAAGIYLATDRHLWGEFFVTAGVVAIAIIALVGGGVIVPATRELATLDPAGAQYDRVYRRYLAAEALLGAVVVLAIFVMAAKPFS